MTDLHARLLDATTPLLAGEKYSTARLNGPLAALRAVLDKCAAMRVEHQVGAFIAEEFERVIADALGVKDEELIEKEQHDG